MEQLTVSKMSSLSSCQMDGNGLILEQFAMCSAELVLEDIPKGISFRKEKVLFH